MDSVILLGSLLLVIFLVYSFFFRNNRKAEKKSYYLKRFLRNKEQSLHHIKEVEILAVHDRMNSRAFPGKEITFSEYLDRLKTKYETDYSDSSYKILKRNKLSHSQKQEYTKQLMEQSEDLYLMEVDLGILNKTWKKSVF